MNFNTFFLRSFRILLFPFAILYGLILRVRNFMYDKKWLKSTSFNIPIINVGNLSVGGTGKSPMVDYLLMMLKHRYQLGTISRGYKRRSQGYLLAGDSTTAIEIGDEPMQFHLRHPDVAVAVGEERIVAVPQLLYDRPGTQVIILDDAFQHRAITAGFNIILTDYSNLYTRDFYLPTGDLRDNLSSAARAQVIIVTKCPKDLTETARQEITRELNPLPGQTVLFTCINYGRLYHIVTQSPSEMSREAEILLICGIANPGPLTAYIEDQSSSYEAMFFNDHHIFSIDDLRDIYNRYEKMRGPGKLMITTEKDAVRLIKFRHEMRDMPMYVLPISIHFLFDGEQVFQSLISNFIKNFSSDQTSANLT
jgi:tetraacyldisaccharide 4'-kinase